MNLRAMIPSGSAGSICHLENVKSYMLYLQQYTKIINPYYAKSRYIGLFTRTVECQEPIYRL